MLLTIAAAGAAGATAAAATKVDRALLRPAQVGAGYVIPTNTISRGLKEPTLDLCLGGFLSEVRRVERVQVSYSRLDAADVSNEVVRYWPGGAKQALKEARAVSCTNKKRTRGGQSVTMTVHRLSPKGAPAGSVTLA